MLQRPPPLVDERHIAVPSVPHELLVQLVREHPAVIVELVRQAYGRSVGSEPELLAGPTSVVDLEPAEFRADAVLRVGARSDSASPGAWVVEVQLVVDDGKQFSWPFYVAGLRARLRCRVTLVVLTLDERVARWARAPIEVDDNGSTIRPLVLGPAEIPGVTDPAEASALPELAVVSVLAHGRRPDGVDVGRALLAACRSLDDARGRLYTDIVFAYLDEGARRALEAEMQLDKYEYQSEFARRFVAQGREEGREEGREALINAIFEVFASRGFSVDDAVRQRIAECRDLPRLGAWLRAALTAPSAEASIAG